MLRGSIVYNINLNSFNNIFNLNNKRNYLSKGLFALPETTSLPSV
jgi:hypothetical protein